MTTNTAYSNDNPHPSGRDSELIWTARQHPDELTLFSCYPTRFPGTWVAIVDDRLPMDQIHALKINGFHLYRVTLLPDSKAQLVIREEPHPDRDGLSHELTKQRYVQYDRREIDVPE